jgi:hypothetical protein
MPATLPECRGERTQGCRSAAGPAELRDQCAYYRLVVPLTGGSYAGVQSGSSVTSITYDEKSNNSDLIVKIKR